MPTTDTRFYTSILGAILLGIGLALLIEYGRKPAQPPGLGLSGATAINLCGAIFVAGWLLSGRLEIPLRGRLFLWAATLGLVAISGSEWWLAKRTTAGKTAR